MLDELRQLHQVVDHNRQKPRRLLFEGTESIVKMGESDAQQGMRFLVHRISQNDTLEN